ncbi:hypothetical protein ABT141_34865, partial [Streptomyces anulatus]
MALAGGAPVVASDTVAAAADETPGYAVEDFNYPQADKILAEQGIALKRGDGHIVLVECAGGTGLIEVWARRQDNKKICFRVTGNSGWLTMEIPAVHSIKGNDYTTEGLGGAARRREEQVGVGLERRRVVRGTVAAAAV